MEGRGNMGRKRNRKRKGGGKEGRRKETEVQRKEGKMEKEVSNEEQIYKQHNNIINKCVHKQVNKY